MTKSRCDRKKGRKLIGVRTESPKHERDRRQTLCKEDIETYQKLIKKEKFNQNGIYRGRVSPEGTV